MQPVLADAAEAVVLTAFPLPVRIGMKILLKKSKSIIKGMPSGVLVSIVVHVVAFLLAGLLGVFTITQKEGKKFVPPTPVERPKMRLRKPKVKVKKTAKPKPTTRIVTKVNRASMPDIQLPEMSGMQDGIGGGIGGFDMMPALEKVSVFGSGRTIGNDFVGTFYDFKRDRRGRTGIMDPDKFTHELKEFVRNGWKPSSIARYYRSPKKLYATTFAIPPILSSVAPAAFDEADTVGYCWMAHYKGQLVHKDGITFRFWGMGDDIMVIRVDGKLVLNACWPGDTEGAIAHDWHSTSSDSRKYRLGNNDAVIGDWITLEPGVPQNMEVMIGEVPGGVFCAMLVVEEKGVEYEKNSQSGPVLPIFKTTEPSLDLIEAIHGDLVPGEACVTNGPVFRDYAFRKSEKPKKENPPAPQEVASKASMSGDPEVRTWTLAKGRALE
ncbi:MAG: hypothetical protein K9M45_03560, partial [Kiritimatiellales bacterium]|nr:hypothetical protein [Kiritimatiellales bacterium]